MPRDRKKSRREERTPDKRELESRQKGKEDAPRTTTGKITSPKFGSAGSGGAEYERIDEEETE